MRSIPKHGPSRGVFYWLYNAHTELIMTQALNQESIKRSKGESKEYQEKQKRIKRVSREAKENQESIKRSKIQEMKTF